MRKLGALRTTLKRISGYALQLKRTRDRLEKLAVIDPFTGIGNRRSFDLHIGRELRRAVRSKSWLSVLCLVSAADDLLYRAKQSGRNQGIHHDMESDTTATQSVTARG